MRGSLLLMLAGALVPGAARVQEWTHVRSTEGGTIYIDLASIKPEGVYWSAWAKGVLNEPLQGFVEVQNRSLYDCKQRRVRQLEFLSKRTSGEMIAEDAGANPTWEVPSPGSPDDALLNALCKKTLRLSST